MRRPITTCLVGGFLLWEPFCPVAAQAAEASKLLGALLAQASASPKLQTFDYTLRYTIYSEKTAKAAENHLRFAVDKTQRALYAEQVIGKTPNLRLIFRGGHATAYDLRADETFVPSEELLAPFLRWFDQPAYPDIHEQDLSRARYLGKKDYGEIAFYRGDERDKATVQGQVVEVVAVVPDFLGTSLGRVPVKLLFAQKEHIASVYRVEGEARLVVYRNPADPLPLPRYLNAHLYTLGPGEPRLEARTRLEAFSVNQAIDATLFGELPSP